MEVRCRGCLALVLFVSLCCSGAQASAVSDAGASGSLSSWIPPIPGTYQPPLTARVKDPFRLPSHPYGPGNRGLEYAVIGGESVAAISAGRVVFAGAVAGRLGVSIQHPDGRRSSVTFLAELLVHAGETVKSGTPVGLAAPGLHLGVREGDRYIDPATLWSASMSHGHLTPLIQPLVSLPSQLYFSGVQSVAMIPQSRGSGPKPDIPDWSSVHLLESTVASLQGARAGS